MSSAGRGDGSTFISYVSEAEKDSARDKKLAEAMSKMSPYPEEQLEKELLPGEIVIGNANKVIRYNVHDDTSRGISGSLTCTNFRLIFLTAEKASYDLIELKNRMLNELDILLNNVESIFVEYPNKRKRLVPGSKIKDGIQKLELQCKDFRVAAFNFKFTLKGEEKKVIKAIVYHSYPQAVTRMFAFDYKHGKDINKVCDVPLYRCQADWEHELDRCNVPKKLWRVTVMNRKFTESPTMPAYFIVPASIKDNELTEASKHFTESRLPMWSWTDPNGCTMSRMAALRSDTEHVYYETKLHKAIEASDLKRRPVKFVNISKLCPSCLQLQQSFNKLKNICMPGNEQNFWDTDREWLSTLHSSKWMQHVSSALTVAKDVACALRDEKRNVAIQETNGIDVTPVVTSLVQLMLDPSARTLRGLQALIQREWVVAGHPFLDRLGHLCQPKRKKTKQLMSLTEEGESTQMAPVFLLFLDCVYQMMVQFPAKFEPSTTFLTVLYDATQLTIFDTFIFNNEKQRHDKLCEYGLHDKPYALQEVDKVPPSQSLPIWAWERQYTKRDMSLFNNPLYRMRVLDDDTNYAEKSYIRSERKRCAEDNSHGTRIDRNGDLPDGVTSFCKQPRKSPTKSPARGAKKKSNDRNNKTEEQTKRTELDTPHPINKACESKKEPFKATVGGHYPKVALMPNKNHVLGKQTSMITTAGESVSKDYEGERMSRSKSYGDRYGDDDVVDVAEEGVFVPLSEFEASRSTENDGKARSRFSFRRKKAKDNGYEHSTEEPKTYPARMQDLTVQPRPAKLPGASSPLYPKANVANLKFWRQCYLRWLHWSQVYGGGPASLLQQESFLYDDIHILHNKVQILKTELMDGPSDFPPAFLDRGSDNPSGMYFYHDGESDAAFDGTSNRSSSQNSINLLSSYYPYSPITGLRSDSVLGTPMSHFLQGGSFFNFGRNRGRHSRTASGISITRSVAQSVEDLTSVTIPVLSSKSVEDLTSSAENGMRQRVQSDLPSGRRRSRPEHKTDSLPSQATLVRESVSYETSL